MNKEKILEAFYEVINDTIDWYTEGKNDNTYVHFVIGALAMTDKLLEKIEINNPSGENKCRET